MISARTLHLVRWVPRAAFCAALVSFSSPTYAQKPPTASDEASAVKQLQDTIDSVDPLFAQYVVRPINAVFFFDVLFWDNGRSSVNDVAYASGKLLSAGEDGRFIVWDKDGTGTTYNFEDPVRVTAARPGYPDQVALGFASGAIRLVDLNSGETVSEYEGAAGEPTTLAFDDTGARLVAGTSLGQVYTWGQPGAAVQMVYKEPGARVSALAVRSSPGETELAWALDSSQLYRGVLGAEEAPVLLKGHRRGVRAVTFGAEGQVVSGGEDGRVLVHAQGAIEPSSVLTLSEEPVVDIVVVASDEYLVARPSDIQVLSLKAGEWAESNRIKTPVNHMSFSEQGTLAVARNQGQVAVIDLKTGESNQVLAGHATEATLPFIVLWLVVGAVFFTLRFSFVNLRAFGHAIAVTKGDYDEEGEEGDVSHFQALAMALSATVGLGNIAGVAVAVGTGGPGAVFWMIIAGFLGMSSKFAECTLGQMYRTTDATGKVSGGPMHYLRDGLSELGFGWFGRVLSVLFAFLCIGGSLGGGNMFQANQSYAQVASVIPIFSGEIGSFVYGLLLSGLVGVVIIGGIDRIGQVASYIVPFMVGIYLLAAVFIVVVNITEVPMAFMKIVTEAFSPQAAFGGALGVMVTGFRRAAFSNEAGVGSASIVHSAAATKEPVREGIVALLEPFIDTIVVCTTTALVLVITGAYQTEADGVVMTSKAFATVLPWFPNVLTVAVFLFAFSTMISWSYYGERCWCFLFGDGTRLIYKIIFVVSVVVGSVVRLGSVLDFSDLMILAMAFPNMLGAFLLSGKVRALLADYLARLQSGDIVKTR